MINTKFSYVRELIRATRAVGLSASASGSRIRPEWLVAAMNSIEEEIDSIEEPDRVAWDNPDGPNAA